nr:hypothetical protein [Wolbachia endosymbiont of Litomosoides sigmodontis]
MLVSLIMVGKVELSIAIEISTMYTTEQIDAPTQF